MKKGFTMIELIFVIVILGILAAVAIPRLAATRDDAVAARVAANLATVVADAGAVWTAQGAWPASWSLITNVQLQTAANDLSTADAVAPGTAVFLGTGALANATDACYSLVTGANGAITVTALAAGTAPGCAGAKAITTRSNISGADGVAVVTTFGGRAVRF